jgi:predicted transcriptional regulator
MSHKQAHRLVTATDALRKLLGPTEVEVMRILWAQGSLTVKVVHKQIAATRELAYTTVMTTMVRLFEKGLLRREEAKQRYSYVYTPAISEPDFVAQRLADILDAVTRDYPSALTQYLDIRRETGAASQHRQ